MKPRWIRYCIVCIRGRKKLLNFYHASFVRTCVYWYFLLSAERKKLCGLYSQIIYIQARMPKRFDKGYLRFLQDCYRKLKAIEEIVKKR